MSDILGGANIVRIFTRRTSATPTDALVFVGEPPLELPEVASEIHISCTFTWDVQRAEVLAKSWSRFGLPVTVGGPAFGEPGGNFTPGLYLREGYTITSRGCRNSCWFCSVWKREKGLRELPIRNGWIVQDDNLLACSEAHIRAVFAMLNRQPRAAVFSGGIEAALLRPWHVDILEQARVDVLFCAYDTADDLEPLRVAGAMLNEAGLTFANRKARCYVLCGYPHDTIEAAKKRMLQTVKAGFMPQSMLYQDDSGGRAQSCWKQFHRSWARPAAIAAQLSHNPPKGLFGGLTDD